MLIAAFLSSAQIVGAQQSPIESVTLFEGGSLWGELDVFVRKDGTCFVREVSVPRRDSNGNEIKSGFLEERYKLSLSAGDFSTLESLLTKHNFYNLKIKERSGVPDEEHTQIDVVLSSGKRYSAWRWTMDKNEHFDAIVNQLSKFVIRAKKTKPFFKGPWDGKSWQPTGFY